MRIFNSIKLSTILVLLSVLFLACREEFDIELNEPENIRIVVEGRITNELKHHRIRLTHTSSYFYNQPAPAIKNCKAHIIEKSTGLKFDLTELENIPGIYETPRIQGKVFDEYTLNITDGDNTYQASAYLDTVAAMDSINYQYNLLTYFSMNMGFYYIKMSAFEPGPVGNIYMFKVYLNDTLITDKMSKIPYQDDRFFNNTYLSEADIYYLPQEQVKLKTNKVRLEMYSISKAEYNYNNNFRLETQANGSIFSGPPANIPSNIINTNGGLDGLGFFAASATTSAETILIKEHDESTNNPDFKP